jgi:predicted nucleic acid-binding OB-fold protein
MATTPINLYTNDGTAVSYNLQGTTGNVTRYISPASSLRLPDGLAVNHRTKAAGAKGSDTHQVLKQLAKADPATGEVGFVSMNMNLSVARNPGITDTDVVDEVAKSISYFVGDLTSTQRTKLAGVVTALIDGITP